jgi:hypothetical protein
LEILIAGAKHHGTLSLACRNWIWTCPMDL